MFGWTYNQCIENLTREEVIDYFVYFRRNGFPSQINRIQNATLLTMFGQANSKNPKDHTPNKYMFVNKTETELDLEEAQKIMGALMSINALNELNNKK